MFHFTPRVSFLHKNVGFGVKIYLNILISFGRLLKRTNNSEYLQAGSDLYLSNLLLLYIKANTFIMSGHNMLTDLPSAV